MSPVSKLQDTFSRHEIAAIGRPFLLVLGLVLVVAIGKGQALFAIAIAVLLLTSGIVIWIASACPDCGKSPFHSHFFQPGSVWNRVLPLQNLWPESVCSGCGTTLVEP